MDELKIVTDLANEYTAIKITDVSVYNNDRANYGLVAFISTDNFVVDCIPQLEQLMASEIIIPVEKFGNTKIAAFALPKYDSGTTYANGAVVFQPEINDNNDVDLKVKIYDSVLTEWTVINNNSSALLAYQAILASVADAYTAYSLETAPVTGFTLLKHESMTYRLTPPDSSAYEVSVFSFDNYINERSADQVLNMNVTPIDIVLPADGIWVVVIFGSNGSLTYIPVYCFETLHMVMKALLKKIFCPEHLNTCTIEETLQLQQDRLFITKVSVGMGTLIGMIHSEQVDHYHYFSMSEDRLAALQRANDILVKTLALFSEYNYSLPCNCHV
jgi:hypothetical protein